MRLAPLFATLAIAAVPAGAQDDAEVGRRHTPEYRACVQGGDAARGVTAGILNCLGSEIERQDARLNETYRTQMSALAPSLRTGLRASERRWIVQRDEQCRAHAAEVGGTLASILYSSCILDQTIRRTMWLETYRP